MAKMRSGGRSGVPYNPKKKQTLIEVPEQPNILPEEPEPKIEKTVLNEVKKDSTPKKHKSSKSQKFFESKEDSGN